MIDYPSAAALYIAYGIVIAMLRFWEWRRADADAFDRIASYCAAVTTVFFWLPVELSRMVLNRSDRKRG